MFRIAIPSLALLLASAFASAEGLTTGHVQAPTQWGRIDVVQVKHLYFAGQPGQAALEAAKAAGVELIVNLRTPAEMATLDFDEAAAAAALGIRYENVPVGKPPFSAEAFERVEQLIGEVDHAPVLIHCASGQRASGWLAAHAVTHHEVSIQEALQIGRLAGMKSPVIEDGVRELVAKEAK